MLVWNYNPSSWSISFLSLKWTISSTAHIQLISSEDWVCSNKKQLMIKINTMLLCAADGLLIFKFVVVIEFVTPNTCKKFVPAMITLCNGFVGQCLTQLTKTARTLKCKLVTNNITCINDLQESLLLQHYHYKSLF